MSERPAGSHLEFSAPAPLFLFVGNSPAMVLRATVEIHGIAVADRLSHALQPVPRPCELDTQDRKAHRDYDDGRARRHDHDQPDQQNGNSNHGNRYAASDLVREMDSLPDQPGFPERLILLRAIVALIA